MKAASTLRFLLFVSAVFFSVGCNLERSIDDFRTVTENALNDAIAELASASADWQHILQELQEKLPEEVRTTIGIEVSNLAARSIAQAGVELRCNADFIRGRVRQGLERVKVRFLGGTAPPIEPGICHIVPIAVERALVPERINKLEIYGYDFDHASDLRVFHERTGGRVDVTSQLDLPTHYAMTLNLGASGVRLDTSSQRLSLEWGGRKISTIAIIQPSTRICRARTERFAPTNVTLRPRHTRGDRDFKGHGPTIITSVTLLTGPSALHARVYMKAYESNSNNSPKSDHTTAEQTRTFPLYNAPAGWRIVQVLGPQTTSHSYRDSNHNLDSFSMRSGGPVQRFVFVGDTGGDEAGTETQVDINFNRLNIELEETGDCVSRRAIRTLRNANLLRASTFSAVAADEAADESETEP